LTVWERELRLQAGQMPGEISFVGRLARDLLFYEAPQWVFTLCYVGFGLLVLAMLVLVPIRRGAGPGSLAPVRTTGR
jgi:tellurite resistance protein TehA-like permease